MKQSELKKLIKLEDRINSIARENGLEFRPIEFDVVPEQKMFEIMAYGMPGQISNWKYGRDFEKTRTIFEERGGGLPYEVVVNTDPARAYLMKDNSFALNALIIAHVVGHVAFFCMNKFFSKVDKNIASRLSAASKRFDEYERNYGIDIVELTVDAGHALMWHSNPFLLEETEQDKIKRIFKRLKKQKHQRKETEFADLLDNNDDDVAEIEREKWNQQLLMRLKQKSPVEPQEDILRYIIDNSRTLMDWQKDILEIIRSLGQYYWPNMQTKYMNEGFATYWHERILRQLFNEGLLNHTDHAECNYTNSLVKAKSPYSMNPYLIGFEIWTDLVDRWNKGKHGFEWENMNMEDRLNYDNGSMEGREKMFEVLRTHTDWIFMNNFLTTDLIQKLEMYMYIHTKDYMMKKTVVVDKKLEELRKIIVNSFAHSSIPKIAITNGNHAGKGVLLLEHEHVGMDLHPEYAKKTMEHIAFLWNDTALLETIREKSKETYIARIRKTGELQKFE